MKTIGKFLLAIILLAIVVASGSFVYQEIFNPCRKPLKYSIGRFDPQFGLTRERFKSFLADSEKVWEETLNRDIFIYDPSSGFEVNLVYDERQLQTVQKQKTEFGLSAMEEVFKQLDGQFNRFKKEYEDRVTVYETALAAFQARKSAYDAEVSSWNGKGGAPKNQYEILEAERRYLNSEAARLNAEASSINALTKELNDLLKDRNAKAVEYNQLVAAYNKKYNNDLEFNQAEYTGREINVYQFGDERDLVLALTHEFGHALGLGHVDNPESIMYYLSGDNAQASLLLSGEDMEELKKACKVE